MGGELLKNIVQVIPTQMELAVSTEHNGAAMLRAGKFATIQTRGIGKDHLCGNEVTFYPPLTETAHSMPTLALTDSMCRGTFTGSAAHLSAHSLGSSR